MTTLSTHISMGRLTYIVHADQGGVIRITRSKGMVLNMAGSTAKKVLARYNLQAPVIYFESSGQYITAAESPMRNVHIRCDSCLTDLRDTEALDAFVARHGGPHVATEYLKECYRRGTG